MTHDQVVQLARRINSTGIPKVVAYIAGGGTEVLPMLLANGGGSATLLSARIPYDANDFRAVLGCDPGRLVAARSARGLAMAAFRHALAIRGNLSPEEVFGLGSTSKLTRGHGERVGRSHEIHAAIQTGSETRSWSITLPEGRDRAWEERINSLFLLKLIASGKSVSDSLPLEHGGIEIPPQAISREQAEGEPAVVDLLVGRRRWVVLGHEPNPVAQGRNPEASENGEAPALLLPGSFRPLHAGHVAMAEAASRLTGLPCGYEISLFHPDKPPLDYLALRSRRAGFAERRSQIYLTNAPTYLEKARLFPGCIFAVGHDTAMRIVDSRYYGGVAHRDAMLDELESLGTRFLVFGRVDASGTFRDFSAGEFDHPVAGFLTRTATPVPQHDFRIDLSSTEIRQRSGSEID